MTLDELNAISDVAAGRALRACCGASRWVDAMVARRPYGSEEELLETADAVWRELGPDDWREAIAQHPRIGEMVLESDARSRAWSSGEQSGVSAADDAKRAAVTAANKEYEERFGHIFLINATGKSATEILAACRSRMSNAPDEELAVAGEELRKITRIRLEKLITPANTPRP